MKMHVGVNVTDLEKSIEFYSKVFNSEPVKVKPDYAKFLLDDPGLNFTLNLKERCLEIKSDILDFRWKIKKKFCNIKSV